MNYNEEYKKYNNILIFTILLLKREFNVKDKDVAKSCNVDRSVITKIINRKYSLSIDSCLKYLANIEKYTKKTIYFDLESQKLSIFYNKDKTKSYTFKEIDNIISNN